MERSDTLDAAAVPASESKSGFFFWNWLEEIDRTSPSWSLSRSQATRRLLLTLIFASLCLFIVEYIKHSQYLRLALDYLGDAGLPHSVQRTVLMSEYSRLYAYGWWSFWIFLGYVLLPLLFIRYVLKETWAEHGLQWGATSTHKVPYLILGAIMATGAIVTSFSSSFNHYYPMYGMAGRSWFDYLMWQCVIYLPQFIWVEFFFRGFLLRALQPAIGAGAILVMIVPYTMIHFPKPMFESVVALAFGLIAGALALRSRSIWGGVVIHVIIALAMDTMALVNTNRVPVSFWP